MGPFKKCKLIFNNTSFSVYFVRCRENFRSPPGMLQQAPVQSIVDSWCVTGG